jgi:hypothetical protein
MHERKDKVDGPKEDRNFCKEQRSKFTASGKKPLNRVVFVVEPKHSSEIEVRGTSSTKICSRESTTVPTRVRRPKHAIRDPKEKSKKATKN